MAQAARGRQMEGDDSKRGREEDEEADVGPPRPPEGADDGAGGDDGDFVGPAAPKQKKRKVCPCPLHYQYRSLDTRSLECSGDSPVRTGGRANAVPKYRPLCHICGKNQHHQACLDKPYALHCCCSARSSARSSLQASHQRRYALPITHTQVLEFEQQYLDTLPSAQMYERSYMHRDVVTHCLVRWQGYCTHSITTQHGCNQEAAARFRSRTAQERSQDSTVM